MKVDCEWLATAAASRWVQRRWWKWWWWRARLTEGREQREKCSAVWLCGVSPWWLGLEHLLHLIHVIVLELKGADGLTPWLHTQEQETRETQTDTKRRKEQVSCNIYRQTERCETDEKQMQVAGCQVAIDFSFSLCPRLFPLFHVLPALFLSSLLSELDCRILRTRPTEEFDWLSQHLSFSLSFFSGECRKKQPRFRDLQFLASIEICSGLRFFCFSCSTFNASDLFRSCISWAGSVCCSFILVNWFWFEVFRSYHAFCLHLASPSDCPSFSLPLFLKFFFVFSFLRLHWFRIVHWSAKNLTSWYALSRAMHPFAPSISLSRN